MNTYPQNASQRTSGGICRTSGGRPPEAGRQHFERSAAAIRGRKKPFANRIREFNICRGLKRLKNEISEFFFKFLIEKHEKNKEKTNFRGRPAS